MVDSLSLSQLLPKSRYAGMHNLSVNNVLGKRGGETARKKECRREKGNRIFNIFER